MERTEVRCHPRGAKTPHRQVKANQMTKKWEIKVIIEDLKSGNFVSMEESLDVVNKETSQGYLEIE